MFDILIYTRCINDNEKSKTLPERRYFQFLLVATFIPINLSLFDGSILRFGFLKEEDS